MNKEKSKILTLNKETLRDLMANNAGEVKGGTPTNGKKCRRQTQYGITCPSPTYNGCTNTCGMCGTLGCW